MLTWFSDYFQGIGASVQILGLEKFKYSKVKEAWEVFTVYFFFSSFDSLIAILCSTSLKRVKDHLFRAHWQWGFLLHTTERRSETCKCAATVKCPHCSASAMRQLWQKCGRGAWYGGRGHLTRYEGNDMCLALSWRKEISLAVQGKSMEVWAGKSPSHWQAHGACDRCLRVSEVWVEMLTERSHPRLEMYILWWGLEILPWRQRESWRVSRVTMRRDPLVKAHRNPYHYCSAVLANRICWKLGCAVDRDWKM